jgi:hypothetical protein
VFQRAMRTPLLLAALAAVAVACAAMPEVAGADHRHRRCFPKFSRTIAVSDRARIYETAQDDNGHSATVVCAFRTGRRVLLGDSYDLDVAYNVTMVRFAKWRVAVAWYSSTKPSPYTAGLDLVDMRRGERRGVATMYSEGSFTDVELKPNGSLAWIQQRAGAVTVIKVDASGRHELDSGTGIARDSLALSGSWLYWTNDGQPRVATLD